jgi:hypothetical protein
MKNSPCCASRRFRLDKRCQPRSTPPSPGNSASGRLNPLAAADLPAGEAGRLPWFRSRQNWASTSVADAAGIPDRRRTSSLPSAIGSVSMARRSARWRTGIERRPTALLAPVITAAGELLRQHVLPLSWARRCDRCDRRSFSSVVSLADFSPSHRYFGRVISCPGHLRDLVLLRNTAESQPAEITKRIFGQIYATCC